MAAIPTIFRVPSLLALTLLLVACDPGGPPADSVDPAEASGAEAAAAASDPAGQLADTPLSILDPEPLHEYISVLASDEFEGRAPATRGEELTLDYLTEHFDGLGLEVRLQPVPLVSITADPEMELRITGADGTETLAYRDDMMGWTTRVVDEVTVEGSELVFVGYGVVAPEYGWNDYEGLDVEGRTVVMLINDPGFATQDPELFNGRSMTLYGRWTYKFEEAARQGAAAAIIVHETEPAAYGWDVVAGSWSGPQFGLVTEDLNLSRLAFESWITEDAARATFARAGEDFSALREAARSPDFRPVPLGDLRADVTVRNTLEESETHNVVATLQGRERPDEYVIYTAHWDHLGTDGDEIYNGAVDNASGTAAVMRLAEAFAARDEAPERSVVFLPVGAEEQGLLGSAHYAANPVYPLARTVAVINIDGPNYIGPTRDIQVVGYGNSELDDYLKAAAERRDRVVEPEDRPEAGFFYRSDHFSFARQGVPALYTKMGADMFEGGVDRGRALAAEYTAERYHAPADEYDPAMDLRGLAMDLELLFEVGLALADSDDWPNWAEGNEFRAARDAQRGGG